MTLVTIDQSLLYELLAGAAMFSAAFVGFGFLVMPGLLRRGKARVIWYDPDAGTARLAFYRIRKGDEIRRGKKEPEGQGQVILDQKARLLGEYPTWVIHPKHGWCYYARSAEKALAENPRLAALSVSNPETYAKAIDRNEWSEVLDANKPAASESWIKYAVIGAVVVFALLIVLVGYLVHAVAASQGAH